MATKAQIDANRANAQLSTGPKSSVGKAASAANATRHGLQANPTAIFENNPHERTQYDNLKSRLLEQILPEGELELQTFERYVFALYQSGRARQHDIDAQDRWLNEPKNELWFLQMERVQKLGAMFERRADKALNEIRRLQRDRLSSRDVMNQLYIHNQFIPVPATLPVSDMRRTSQNQTSAFMIASQLMTNEPDCMAILRGEVKAKEIPPIKITPEDLLCFHQQVQG